MTRSTSGVGAPRLAWRLSFGGLLALTMAGAPMALFALSALSPLVIAEFGLTRTQFGSLASVGFAVAAVMAALGGSLADVLGGRVVVAVVLVISGASIVVAGVAPSFAWLLAAAALSGLAQSVTNPVTNQLIAAHIPPGRQGLLLGIKQSGVQMGQGVAGFTLPVAAVALGWRGAILAAAVGVLLVTAAVPAVLPRRAPAAVSASRQPRSPLGPSVAPLALFSFIAGCGMHAVGLYLPLFAFERVGLTAVAAGTTVGVLGAVGIVSRIAWGRLAERRRSPIGALLALVAASAASLVMLMSSEFLGPAMLWAGAVVFGASALAVNSVVGLLIVQRVAGDSMGRASGIVAFGQYSGFMTGPFLFGVLADATGQYPPAWALLVSAYVIGFVVVLRARHRLRPED